MLPDQASAIRAAAQSLTREWNILHRVQGHSAIGVRVDAATALFDRLYSTLTTAPAKTTEQPDPLLEVRENPRLLFAVLIEMRSMSKELDSLPRVSENANGRAMEEEPRIAAMASAFLNACGAVWSSESFSIFVEEVQRDEPLLLSELWPLASLLKFVLLEQILTDAHSLALFQSASDPPSGPATAASIAACFNSLREIGHTDWVGIIEPLIVFDKVLQQDPARAYLQMEFETRQRYRLQVARLASRSECTELKVAEAALDLARTAPAARSSDDRVRQRRTHVGYYLIDKGAAELKARIGHHPRPIDRLRTALRNNGDYFYIGGAEVLTVLLIGIVLAPLMANYSPFGGLSLAFLLLLLPATQGAIDLIINTVTALFHAETLPRLDLSKGIPEEFATLVAVPTLLIAQNQVRELVESIEVRFLANQDRNLHFALLTDLPDSVTKPRQNDSDPLVDLAVELIAGSNTKYGHGDHGAILLLHRHRIFNARQEVWMGWERKRGKLLDLNKYLRGEFNAFPVTAGNVEVLRKVRYIITLDADTQLPRGVAQQLIGAMAHPLNRAIIDPESRVVTDGYGILQPRVGVSVHSASRSRLAAIYSGQTGFDIYTRAVSDAYQDLFGEGIFTGKGIYEVSTFHAVLDRRFPRNSLLSHDLIEGSYVRAGLATDVEVIDDYPSHYSAFTRRKHRWVRGDWQIAQWLFARVPDESGKWVRNPISTISRWKIFDNLRRSLVEPFTFTLLLAGWLGLPGGALYWTIVTLVLLVLPAVVQLGFSIGRAVSDPQPGALGEAVQGFLQALAITLLNLIFLAHQTLLSMDAIVRAMVRRFVTGRRLLEWETAAEAETNTSRRSTVDRYLSAMPAVALLLAVLVYFVDRRALLVAAPILLLWGSASLITRWLNHSPAAQQDRLNAGDEQFLRHLALRIWRFYADFSGEKRNNLVPDNVEEDSLFEAARVSPTNIGMLLNARQAACALGFITTPEFAAATSQSLATIERLPKEHGHLYNWYNTETLAPLLPITISSVDSGNLAASLYTLSAGARALLQQPLVEPEMFVGLRTILQMPPLQEGGQAAKHGPGDTPGLDLGASGTKRQHVEALIAQLAELPGGSATKRTIGSSGELSGGVPMDESRGNETRIDIVRSFIDDYAPWLLPQFARLPPISEHAPAEDGLPLLCEAEEFAAKLDQHLARTWAATGSSHSVEAEQLRSLLPAARERLHALTDSLTKISDDAVRLADEMNFGFLLQPGRGLLSIGYEVESGKLLSACYDMLASEARIATFIAVAKGDIPQQSWFKLGRTHTRAFGRSVLLSWTGTMFEYLMPSLWMRSYPDTLISRTQAAAVAIQRSFAEGLPAWGISESGHAPADADGHYPYLAFGIPQIALKWDATAGPVVSPYSSFLALGVDSCEALRNLRKMAALGWVGQYGFYEAADFTAEGQGPVLVREWMAHHQGMSLLAILNLLKDNLVQRWFHSTPKLQATELLLHEKPVREAVLKADHKRFAALGALASRGKRP